MTSAKLPPKSTPKPIGKDTIYVDVEDEITAIIDKVESAKQKVVALVLPKRAVTLQSIVNMRLLKRSTESAGKNVVLITSESALLPLAGAAGLHVAKNLQSKPEIPPSPKGLEAEAETPVEDLDAINQEADDQEAGDEDKPAKLDYHRSIGELASAHEPEEPESINLDNEEPAAAKTAAKSAGKAAKKNKKLKVPNFDRFRLILVIGAVVLIALIIFFLFASSIFAKAKITIQTTSTPVSANFNLTTSGNAQALDESNNTIPASLKTQDQTSSQQVPATGQQNNGQKASGSVTMSAGNCGPNVPADIPAGTGISSQGLTYITQTDTQFSPVVSKGKCTFSSTNSTSIIAQSPGAKYNGATSFSTSSGVTANADNPTSGGTDNIVTVVTQADVNNAQGKVTSQSSDSFTKTFESQLTSGGNYVLTSTLKIGDPVVTPSPAVGQQATNVSVSVKITYSVLVVQNSDLNKAITDTLNKQFDQTKQRLSSSNVVKDASVTVSSQSSPTNATLAVSENTTAVPIIDTSSVKTQAEGKKSGDIRSNLSSYPGVKSVNVSLSPFWVSKAPKNPNKITVVQQQVNSSGQ